MIYILRRIAVPLVLVALFATLWIRSYPMSDIFTLGGPGGQMNFVRCDRGVFTLCISRHDLGPAEMGVFRHMRTDTPEFFNPESTPTPANQLSYEPLDVLSVLSGKAIEELEQNSPTRPPGFYGGHFALTHIAIEREPTDNRAMSIAIAFPFAYLLLPCLLWLIVRLRGAIRVERRRRLGLCMTCGYDLRESPERCPECGTVPEGRAKSEADSVPSSPVSTGA